MFHGLAWLNHTLSVYLCDGWTSNFNKNMSQFVLWSNLQSSKVSCVLLPPLLATDLGTLGNHGKRGWVKLETGLRRIWDVWWMVLVALCFPMIFRLWYDLFKSIYICCLMYLSVIVLTMLVVNRLDLLSFFLAAGISAGIQNMHDVSWCAYVRWVLTQDLETNRQDHYFPNQLNRTHWMNRCSGHEKGVVQATAFSKPMFLFVFATESS